MFCNLTNNQPGCAHLHIQHVCHCQGHEPARTGSNKIRVNLQVQCRGDCDYQIMRQLRRQEIDEQTNTENVIDGLLKHNAGLAKYINRYAPRQGDHRKQSEQYQRQPNGHGKGKYVSIVEEKGLNYGQPADPNRVDKQYKPENQHMEQQTSPRVIEQQHPDRRARHPTSPKKHNDKHESNGAHSGKLAKYYKDLSQSSRYLSDTGFRKHFHRQCFQNYGRNNTTGVADGIVYGNYLKTFNINPHSGDNFPPEQETHQHALVTASPEKYEEYKGITRPTAQNQQGDGTNECENHGKGFDGSCQQLQHQKIVRDPIDMDEVAKSAEKHQQQRAKYTNIKLVQKDQQEPTCLQSSEQRTSQQYHRKRYAEEDHQIDSKRGVSEHFQRSKITAAHHNNVPISVSPQNMEEKMIEKPSIRQSNGNIRSDIRHRYQNQERPQVISFPQRTQNKKIARRTQNKWQAKTIIPPVVTISDNRNPSYCLHPPSIECLQSPEFQQQFQSYVIDEGFKKDELAHRIKRFKNHVACNICSERKYTKCCCT